MKTKITKENTKIWGDLLDLTNGMEYQFPTNRIVSIAKMQTGQAALEIDNGRLIPLEAITWAQILRFEKCATKYQKRLQLI